MHPVQIAGYKRMSAADKFRQMQAMYRAAVAMKVVQFRSKHPDWTEDELERAARQAVMYAPD